MTIKQKAPTGTICIMSVGNLFYKILNYLLASSIATATATVIPTMGLLPAPINPIIST